MNKKLKTAKKFAKKAQKENRKSAQQYHLASTLYVDYLKTAKKLEKKFDYELYFFKMSENMLDYGCRTADQLAQTLQSNTKTEQKFNAIKKYIENVYRHIEPSIKLFIDNNLNLDQELLEEYNKSMHNMFEHLKKFAKAKYDAKDFDMYYNIYKLVFDVDDTKDYDHPDFIKMRMLYAWRQFVDRFEKGHVYYAAKYFTVAYYLGFDDQENIFYGIRSLLLNHIAKECATYFGNTSKEKKHRINAFCQCIYATIDKAILAKENNQKQDFETEQKALATLLPALTTKHELGQLSFKKIMKNYAPMGHLAELEYIKQHAKTVELKQGLLCQQYLLEMHVYSKLVKKFYGNLYEELEKIKQQNRKLYAKDPAKYHSVLPAELKALL